MRLLKYASKVHLREKGNIAGRGRGCRQNLYRGKKNLLTTQVENLHAVSHFNTTHLVL